MNQFVFYLEIVVPPDSPVKRMMGTLQARDGAAAREILDLYVETVAEGYGATPVVLQREIHGVMSRKFQVWSLP
jgi:hypothetical protein